jgi:putative transcriptional regulator
MFRIFTLIGLLLTGIGASAGPALPVANPAPVTETTLAPGVLLVARRGQYGPYFAKTVVYLLEHDQTGSVGLVLNRPLGKRVAEMLPDIQSFGIGSYPVYNGGPLSPHIMVMLFRGKYPADLALHVRDDIYASSNLKMLGKLLQADKPASELRLFAGQANWEPGQLEQEVDNASWYVIAGNAALLFEGNPDRLWQRLINQLDPMGIVASNCSPAAVLPCER